MERLERFHFASGHERGMRERPKSPARTMSGSGMRAPMRTARKEMTASMPPRLERRETVGRRPWRDMGLWWALIGRLVRGPGRRRGCC